MVCTWTDHLLKIDVPPKSSYAEGYKVKCYNDVHAWIIIFPYPTQSKTGSAFSWCDTVTLAFEMNDGRTPVFEGRHFYYDHTLHLWRGCDGPGDCIYGGSGSDHNEPSDLCKNLSNAASTAGFPS